LEFQIGDARDYASVASAVARADVIIYAAALKQVPSCEYEPLQAVLTNILGAANVVRAVREVGHNVRTVIGVSTDKACKPINAMGMTKALQERVFIAANLHSDVPHLCVRYGNVLASRGSVLPLFARQVKDGGPVTVTDEKMTRFLLSLDDAVDTIFHALANPIPGAIYVPQVPSASMVDVAQYMIGDTGAPITFTGIRPGEKLHEILISEEEGPRTYTSGDYYAVMPMLPELQGTAAPPEPLGSEFNSGDHVMKAEVLSKFLRDRNVSVDDLLDEKEPLR
jgi:UDP-glucose 4-epimerase